MTPNDLADKVVDAIKKIVLDYSEANNGMEQEATSAVAAEMFDKAVSLLVLGMKPGREASLRTLIIEHVNESFDRWIIKEGPK